MKTILFPTDFSDAANGALRVAKQLAKRSGGTLHVLHSIDSVQRYVDMSLSSTGDAMIPGFEPELLMNMIEKQKAESGVELEKYKAEIEKDGVNVVTHLSTADLLQDINEITAKENIDLLVMGTHGASGFREAFVGSNAQKVVRGCTVPVLTVRDADADFSMDSIVYASDFLEDDINAQIPRVKGLVDAVGAELHLLHVNTPAYFEQTDDVLERMENVAEKYEVDEALQYIYNDFTIEEGILNYCKLVDADLAVLVTHGFTGIKRFLGDNVTETVVNHSKIPVLSLHIK